MALNILSVSASVQGDNSTSRTLAKSFVNHEKITDKVGSVIERDVSRNDVALVSAEHVGAFYTPREERSAEQNALLEQSDALVEELKAANTLVVSTPMYNFGVPASLKAWIDMICRVGETFRYTENGPEGLLNIDTMYLFVATGGAPVDSPVDFLVPYMKQVASFIGIKNVEVIAADRMNVDADASLAKAHEQLEELVAKLAG